MIAAVAFTCVSADGVTVSRVEFTPELKASLGLSGLGSLIKQPLDYAAIEKSGAGGNRVQQHLNLVHTTAARIQLPPLTLKRNQSLDGIADILINYDCLGVCFYEFGGPGNVAAPTHNRHETNSALGSLHPSGDIGHGPILGDEVTNGQGGAMGGQAAFGLVKKPHDLFGYSRTFGGDRVLKVVSQHKVRAVLLVEPSTHGHESRMCLYANSVDGDEV
jgi:hypothetical protein